MPFELSLIPPPSADVEAAHSPTPPLHEIESGATNDADASEDETASTRSIPVDDWPEILPTLPLFAHRQPRALPLAPTVAPGHRRSASQPIVSQPSYPFINDLFAREPLTTRRGDQDVFRASSADKRNAADVFLSASHLKPRFENHHRLFKSPANHRRRRSFVPRTPWAVASADDGDEDSDSDDSDVDPDVSATMSSDRKSVV